MAHMALKLNAIVHYSFSLAQNNRDWKSESPILDRQKWITSLTVLHTLALQDMSPFNFYVSKD